MSFQDELLKFFDHRPLMIECLSRGGSVVISKVDARWITEELMPIIERRVAAERAEALDEAEKAAATSVTGAAGAVARISELPRNRCALAQARREQREKDEAIARKHCSGEFPEYWPHQSWCGCEVAAAILAQED